MNKSPKCFFLFNFSCRCLEKQKVVSFVSWQGKYKSEDNRCNYLSKPRQIFDIYLTLIFRGSNWIHVLTTERNEVWNKAASFKTDNPACLLQSLAESRQTNLYLITQENLYCEMKTNIRQHIMLTGSHASSHAMLHMAAFRFNTTTSDVKWLREKRCY